MILKSYEYYIAMYKDKVFMLPISEDKVASYRIANPHMEPTSISMKTLYKLMTGYKCYISIIGGSYIPKDLYRRVIGCGSSIAIHTIALSGNIYVFVADKADDVKKINEYKYESTYRDAEYDTRMGIDIEYTVLQHYYRYKDALDMFLASGLNVIEQSVINLLNDGKNKVEYSIAIDRSGRICDATNSLVDHIDGDDRVHKVNVSRLSVLEVIGGVTALIDFSDWRNTALYLSENNE